MAKEMIHLWEHRFSIGTRASINVDPGTGWPIELYISEHGEGVGVRLTISEAMHLRGVLLQAIGEARK